MALGVVACKAPDPLSVVELQDLDTFWAVESSSAEQTYIAPVARFRLRNKTSADQPFLRAMATFHRKGEETVPWGTDFKFVTSPGHALTPGGGLDVELKSDGRYHSPGVPEGMFNHALFKDASIEIFVRVGSSQWAKIADAPIERRIGSKTARSTETPTPRPSE